MTKLAASLQGQGLLLTNEFMASRAEVLRQNLERMGVANALVTNEDTARLAAAWPGCFDRVLVDAPCSSSGRWRRNPDGRWTTPRSRVEELIRIQAGLLETAAGGVRKGGVLIYATCSLFEREDERIVEEFLSRHPEFRLEGFAAPDGRPTNGMLRTLPMHADCDGSFAARMRLI